VDVDVDLIGWVGVGLGGTYGCRCGILYAPMLGAVFYAGLVSLASSSYPSPCSPYYSELIGRGVFWVHIHIHTQLPTNPLTSHQFSLTTAHRMMMRSQHHHAV